MDDAAGAAGARRESGGGRHPGAVLLFFSSLLPCRPPVGLAEGLGRPGVWRHRRFLSTGVVASSCVPSIVNGLSPGASPLVWRPVVGRLPRCLCTPTVVVPSLPRIVPFLLPGATLWTNTPPWRTARPVCPRSRTAKAPRRPPGDASLSVFLGVACGRDTAGGVALSQVRPCGTALCSAVAVPSRRPPAPSVHSSRRLLSPFFVVPLSHKDPPCGSHRAACRHVRGQPAANGGGHPPTCRVLFMSLPLSCGLAPPPPPLYSHRRPLIRTWHRLLAPGALPVWRRGVWCHRRSLRTRTAALPSIPCVPLSPLVLSLSGGAALGDVNASPAVPPPSLPRCYVAWSLFFFSPVLSLSRKLTPRHRVA